MQLGMRLPGPARHWAAALALLAAGCQSALGPPPGVGLAVPHATAAAATPPPAPETLHAAFKLRFVVTADAGTSLVDLTVLVPRDVPRRQTIRKLVWSRAPDRVFDVGENRYARFLLRDPPPKTVLEAEVEADIERFDLTRAERERLPVAVADAERRAALAADRYVEVDDPRVRELAAAVTGDTERARIESAFRVVGQALEHHGYDPGEVGAATTLERGGGDCTDYSDVLVAVLRAQGLAARSAGGYTLDHPADTPAHDWVEVLVGGLGWVPLDPLRADLGNATFGELRNIYLRLTVRRNDPLLFGYHYHGYTWDGPGAHVDNELVLP
ncbi:MAG: transglutaminase family protein [Polyangiaceae bacterium]|nr:transglutaminase family protein [Polyangiaceae bacterium]